MFTFLSHYQQWAQSLLVTSNVQDVLRNTGTKQITKWAFRLFFIDFSLCFKHWQQNAMLHYGMSTVKRKQ